MFLLLVHDSRIFPLSFFSLPSHWELQVCLLAYSPQQSEAIQHSHSTNASHSYIIVIGHLRSLTVPLSKMCKGTKWQQACVCSFWAAASTLFKPLWSACRFPSPTSEPRLPEPIVPWQFQLIHGIELFFGCFWFIHSVSRISCCISCLPASTPWEQHEQTRCPSLVFLPVHSKCRKPFHLGFCMLGGNLCASRHFVKCLGCAQRRQCFSSSSRPSFFQQWQIMTNTCTIMYVCSCPGPLDKRFITMHAWLPNTCAFTYYLDCFSMA